jgi:hypothetical protein
MNAHDHPITTAVVGLLNDNERLLKGVANQARIIREQTDMNSALEAQLAIKDYEIELLKGQGRKTRDINRGKLKGFKVKIASQCQTLKSLLTQNETLEARVAQLKSMVSQHERRAVHATDQVAMVNRYNRRLMDEIEQHRQGNPVQLPEVFFIQHGDRIHTKAFREPQDYMTASTTVQIDQLSMRMMFLDEHKGDLRIVECIAKQAATSMTRMLEDKIIETLMGKPMTRDERARSRHEMLMKQQQQQAHAIYGKAGTRSNY